MRHTEYYSASVKQCSQKKQFKYLIDAMQLYHFTDEQWNNLKAILTDNKDGNHLLSQNRLNDEQFGIFCGYA